MIHSTDLINPQGDEAIIGEIELMITGAPGLMVEHLVDDSRGIIIYNNVLLLGETLPPSIFTPDATPCAV